VSIVKEYDRIALYSMLVKLYNHLHPIVDGGSSFANQEADKDYGLDIFQMTSNSTNNKGNCNHGIVGIQKVSCELEGNKKSFPMVGEM
jgi:hypothetical protein